MSNSYFKFKQFTVYQDKCAMKVGTDGVLLGAWTNLLEAINILDIGTGTALVALMLAQRSTPKAFIDAIDIDNDAILQAEDNVKKSPFDTVIKCSHSSLQDYTINTKQRYDVIVSNPPYFSLSLHSPDSQRTVARHTDSLSMCDLLSCASELLSDNGRLSIIYPYIEKANLLKAAANQGLSVSRVTNVLPTPTSSSKRVLLEFSKKEEVLEENNLIVEQSRHIYSSKFAEMVKDFYLNL